MEIEGCIQKNAKQNGALDKADIELIVRWGGGRGNQNLGHIKANDNEYIRYYTAGAIHAITQDDPTRALECVKQIKGLGPSFAPKVLAFLSPQTCPIFDDYIKDCLSKADNPPSTYTDFIRLLKYIRSRLGEGNPRGMSEPWYLRDIEMALYRFAYGPRLRRTQGRYIIGKLLYHDQ